MSNIRKWTRYHTPEDRMLITALMAAVEKGEGQLDREAGSNNDLFDVFHLFLRLWQ